MFSQTSRNRVATSRRSAFSLAAAVSALLVVSAAWGGEGAAQPGAAGARTAQPPRSQTSGPQNMRPPRARAAEPEAQPEALSAEQKKRDSLLRDRVAKRWDALVERDFAQAYQFETPALRATKTVDEYTKGFGPLVRWHGATVDRIHYRAPETADVTVRLDYSFPDPGGGADVRTTGYLTEQWSFREDTWWRSQKTEPLGYAQPAASSATK